MYLTQYAITLECDMFCATSAKSIFYIVFLKPLVRLGYRKAGTNKRLTRKVVPMNKRCKKGTEFYGKIFLMKQFLQTLVDLNTDSKLRLYQQIFT